MAVDYAGRRTQQMMSTLALWAAAQTVLLGVLVGFEIVREHRTHEAQRRVEAYGKDMESRAKQWAADADASAARLQQALQGLPQPQNRPAAPGRGPGR